MELFTSSLKYGFIVTILTIMPMYLLGIYRNRIFLSIINAKKIKNNNTEDLDYDVLAEIEYENWIKSNGWFRVLEIVSILFVYPALIVSAILKINNLNLILIFISCFLMYSLVIFLIVRYII